MPKLNPLILFHLVLQVYEYPVVHETLHVETLILILLNICKYKFSIILFTRINIYKSRIVWTPGNR